MYGGGAVRWEAALDVLFRKVFSRDQRPGSCACAPSVMVDRRWDTGRAIRLAAGNRKEGGLGGNLNSDIDRGAEGSRDHRLQLHVSLCRYCRCTPRQDWWYISSRLLRGAAHLS